MTGIYQDGTSSSFTVYPYGEIVMRNGPFYIKWTPSDLSTGTFTIGGSTYNFSDYSGYFYGFDGTDPSATSSAFYSTGITTIETNATVVGDCFCTFNVSLTSASLPYCEVLGQSDALAYNSNMSYVNIEKCREIGRGGFYGCNNLQSLYLPVCGFIGDYGLRFCYSLKTITLGSTSVCSLGGGVFWNIENTVEAIYVPSSLVSAYQSSWAFFSSRIYPINN